MPVSAARTRVFALLLSAITIVCLHANASNAAAEVVASAIAPHPMPNTVIAISLDDGRIALDVAIPLPELRLAMQRDWPSSAAAMDSVWQRAVTTYLARHIAIHSATRVAQSVVVERIHIWRTTDENVGAYEELRFRVTVNADSEFDTRHFFLVYDAIIHQVPNHFALVQITQDLRQNILSEDRAQDVGVIRYDFSADATPAMRIDVDSGSRWNGLRSVVIIGFRHVAQGFDHLLFLATLLVVAPLRAERGRWTLFQGWRYATTRFLTISIAFTVGHSVALFLGAYQLVHISSRVVEVLIAISIAITAMHAMRPLFPEREWIVAVGFGTIHGLAFAEGISGLTLSAASRALVVGGFNIGIELAQIAAMLSAIPLLIISRWRIYHALRVALMIVAFALATMWAVERAGTENQGPALTALR